MKRYVALSLALVVGAALSFWIPAARAAPGLALAPLDDVYIYFAYARSTATGFPLQWSPGNGYSTGATSPTYALVLALGYLVGLRGMWIALFAAIVACASLLDLCLSLRSIAPPGSRAVWAAPALMLAVPLLDWSWFSGMEAALFGAVLGRALAATARVAPASEAARARAQWVAGGWLALLPLTRPEALPLALALGAASAHASGRLPVLPALLRSLGPSLGALATTSALALALTGELAPAGAVRKLASTDPYASGVDVALRALTNAVRLWTEGLERGVGGRAALALLVLLGALSLLDRRLRRLGVALAAGAVGAFALVCLNSTAPFQNFRYLVPTLACSLVAAQLGLYALEARSRRALAAGAAGAALLAVLALGDAPRQIDHFARSAKNIAEQQVEVGRRLAALSPAPRRVFVNDAGAIPYVSGLSALDGLGLGGYRDYPFARASVHGWPAVVELIERMPGSERPDVLAIYDSWWPGLGARFGERIDAVRVHDNLILGHPEKVIYRADWSLLDARTPNPLRLDHLDVADLVDEREHELSFSRPGAGFVVHATAHDEGGSARWDAGRVLAPGQHLRWSARGRFHGQSARLRVGTDTPDAEVAVRVRGELLGALRRATAERAPERWASLEVAIPYLMPGDRLELFVEAESLRAFEIELLASSSESAPP